MQVCRYHQLIWKTVYVAGVLLPSVNLGNNVWCRCAVTVSLENNVCCRCAVTIS